MCCNALNKLTLLSLLGVIFQGANCDRMLRNVLLLTMLLVLLTRNEAMSRSERIFSLAEYALAQIKEPTLQAFSSVEKTGTDVSAPIFLSLNDDKDGPKAKRRRPPHGVQRPDYVIDRGLEYKKWYKANLAPKLIIGGCATMIVGAGLVTAGVLHGEHNTGPEDTGGFLLAFGGVILAGAGLGMLFTGLALHKKYGRYRHFGYSTPDRF